MFRKATTERFREPVECIPHLYTLSQILILILYPCQRLELQWPFHVAISAEVCIACSLELYSETQKKKKTLHVMSNIMVEWSDLCFSGSYLNLDTSYFVLWSSSASSG